MKQKIIVIGAGGHGKVVSDAIIAQDKYILVGFVDVLLPIGTEVIGGFKVIEKQENLHLLKSKADVFLVAIGNNKVREVLFHLAAEYLSPAIVIHPSVILGSNVSIGEGTVILANAIISAFSEIGNNTIINASSVVDHECRIGSNCHISIGTMVGSNSVVEDNYTSSIGENISSFSMVK